MPGGPLLGKLRDFKLQHPKEQDFPWPWFGFIVLVIAVLFFGILAVLNAILVGYDTVTVFQDNFNVSQRFWYDTIIPGPNLSEPGTLCDKHSFNVGDTFTTNYSLFKWDLVSVGYSTNNSRVGSFPYSGSTLQTCDVDTIYMDVQIQSRSADLTVTIKCEDLGGFRVNATTTFSVGLLKGKYSPPLLGATLEKNEIGTDDALKRAITLNHKIQLARDAFTPLWDAFLLMNETHPIIISGKGAIPACPVSRNPHDACVREPPKFTIDATTIVWSNATHSIFDATTDSRSRALIREGTDIYNGTLNFAQTLIAAVRIDLGNPSPSNIFLNPSALNVTLFPTVSDHSLSQLYEETRTMEPLNMTGPSAIQVLYSCPRWQQGKPIGYAIASVLVATLSMFSSGWAVFMFFVGLFHKYNPTRISTKAGYIQVGSALGYPWAGIMDGAARSV